LHNDAQHKEQIEPVFENYVHSQNKRLANVANIQEMRKRGKIKQIG